MLLAILGATLEDVTENRQLQWLQNSLGNAWTRADRGVAFRSADGSQIIEIKSASRGVRDLYAALMQLAVIAVDEPRLQRAYLIAQLPRMTKRRAKEEWQRALGTLRPDTARRLALIGVGSDGAVVVPEDHAAKRLAALVEEAFRDQKATERPSPSRLSSKSFEVWKVLLGAWLQHEGSLQVGEVAERAGCSYPTVAKTLERLEQRHEVERDTSRSVALKNFPSATLREVLALVETLRRPISFVDATGGDPSPQSLLRRMEARKPPRVALGGVVAARHYDRQLDLHGLPRLDVVMHTPVDLRWVEDLDPALQPASQDETAPVLVVRPLMRPTSAFKVVAEHALPIADPVETLLDLYELRLDAQATDFVKAVRGPGAEA